MKKLNKKDLPWIKNIICVEALIGGVVNEHIKMPEPVQKEREQFLKAFDTLRKAFDGFNNRLEKQFVKDFDEKSWNSLVAQTVSIMDLAQNVPLKCQGCEVAEKNKWIGKEYLKIAKKAGEVK